MCSINSNSYRTHSSNSLHQSTLVTTGNVHKTSGISSIITGVIAAWLIILEAQKKMKCRTLRVTLSNTQYIGWKGSKASALTTDPPASANQKEHTADSYRCKIRIRLLRIQPIVVLNILEGLVHEASITAMIALWPRTVHQVLLTQRNQLSRSTKQLTLQGTCWAESPAGSTPFLGSGNRTLLPNNEQYMHVLKY